MPAPPVASKPPEPRPPGRAAMIAAQREMLAKRIADAPAAWISIPMWGRVFRIVRKVFGIGHEAGSKR